MTQQEIIEQAIQEFLDKPPGLRDIPTTLELTGSALVEWNDGAGKLIAEYHEAIDGHYKDYYAEVDAARVLYDAALRNADLIYREAVQPHQEALTQAKIELFRQICSKPENWKWKS